MINPALARLLCHFFGFLVPAYESFKSARSGDSSSHAQWLTFWIANSYFVVFEIFGDQFLSWMPLYYEMKIGLLVWLVTPRFNGADKIYRQVINPYLLRYEADIDQSLNAMREQGVEKLGELAEVGATHFKKSSTDFVNLGQNAVLTSLLTAAAVTATTTRRRGASVEQRQGGVTFEVMEEEEPAEAEGD